MNTAPDYLKLCQLDGQDLSSQSASGKAAQTEEIKKAKASLAGWNSDVEMAQRELKSEFAKSTTALLPGGVTRESLTPATAMIVVRYAVADTLALHMQSQLALISQSVLLLACGGLICFELVDYFGHLPGNLAKVTTRLMMTAFFVAWCIAIVLDRKAQRDRIQERYQDYRVLAEGLRVQFYWQWAGVNSKASDAYPKRQREHLQWIRYALGQWMQTPQATSTEAKAVLGSWIKNQREYFLGSDGHSGEVEKNRRYNDQCRWYGRLLLYLGIALAGVTALVMWLGESLLGPATYHYLEAHLLLMVGLGLLGAAACYAWRERFAYAEHVKNYTAMANIYQEAHSRMEEGKTAPETILVDLGQEALAESTEWLMLHRERHAAEARL